VPRGTPRRVAEEFHRRGELVRVTLHLERGTLEDLEVLSRHHYGCASRSEVIRRAVTLMLAREAVQVIRGHGIDRSRAEKAAEEARELAFSAEQRDRQDAAVTLTGALDIAKHVDPLGDVG